MTSTNTTTPRKGYVSIPVEILPGPRSSRAHSPSHAYRSDYSHGQPSDSSTWRPSTNRFQPRYSPVTAYDRLINNSQFNQPLQGRFPSHLYDDTSVRHPQQRMNEPSPSYFSRSNDDLLNSSMDTSRPKPTRDYRAESDFLQPNKYASRLRRSYDALNDYPDSYQSFPTRRPQASFEHQQQQQPTYRSTYTTHMNDNTVPSSHQKPHHPSHDQSGSPGPQRGASPAQQADPDLKMAKDTTGPIPMPSSGHSSSSQLPDQQVPSTDAPAPAVVRDPNTIALEKLEQIRQSLAGFDQQVDAFTGTTRNDRQYKILDDLAVKLMMRCDELVDVSADIKEKRKEMIRNVQSILSKLESKVPLTPSVDDNSNQMETTAMVVYDPSATNTHDEQTTSSASEHNSSLEQDKEDNSAEQSIAT